MNSAGAEMEKYMTAKEVAALVQLTEQTIRRYVMLKQIPYHKTIRAVRFKPSEIEKWMAEKENKKGGKKEADSTAGLFNETEGKA